MSEQENTAWLREHGDDPVPVRLTDLLGVVIRMEQVSREADSSGLDLVHQRIFTCDLPRLRRYLPDGAQAILVEEGW